MKLYYKKSNDHEVYKHDIYVKIGKFSMCIGIGLTENGHNMNNWIMYNEAALGYMPVLKYKRSYVLTYWGIE